MELTINDLKTEAERLLIGVADGDPLDPLGQALIDLGVKVAVTSLDVPAMQSAMTSALEAGATAPQIQEVIALISGLGVHTLMLTSCHLLELTKAKSGNEHPPLSPVQQDLWARYVGDDPYWAPFEMENPGFLDALLRLSPDLFKGFHDYCAIPWKSGTVRAITKELIAMASDATPTHRYLPGMRHHMNNAKRLGAGRLAILEALDIAARAPLHSGVR